MRRKQLERELDRLRDGQLDPAAAERLESLLASDTDAGRQLRTTRSIGAVVLESWNDGPAAPDADRLIAALRPEMLRIDREIGEPSRLRVWLGSLVDMSRWAPAATAATAGAAFAVTVAFLYGASAQAPVQVANIPTAPVVPTAAGSTADAGPTIYDLDAESGSVMVYENDGVTILWLNDAVEGLSALPARGGLA